MANARTFLPTLIFFVRKICVYLARHKNRIKELFNNPDLNQVIDALDIACAAFLAIAELLLEDGV